jgi:hypothetical protein
MKFFWDAERGVYVDERGRTVTPAMLRKIQAESERNHVVELVALAVAFAIWRQMSTPLVEAMTPEEIFALVDPAIAEKVQARVRALGPVSSREFQVRMAEQIRLSHNVNAVLAAGGFAAMSFALWNYAAVRTRNEQAFAVRLAAEIELGLVSPAQAINRTSMYAGATYVTFAGTHDKRERAKGTLTAQRILDPDANHCMTNPEKGTPGCPELAQEGFVPIEDVVPIGEATCRQNCRCWIRYGRAAAAVEAAAQLSEEQTEQAA